MPPIWKVLITLALLACCTVAPTDGYDTFNLDELEALLNESIESTSLNELKESGPITGIKTNRNVDEHCGTHRQCVARGKCKSLFEDNFYGNLCRYEQTCCHINMIAAPVFAQEADKFQVCGQWNVDGINATTTIESQFGEFPWNLAILLASESGPEVIGGGSLIAPNVAVTAASMTLEIHTNKLVVRAGEWDRSTVQERYPHQDRTVKQVLRHDQFDKDANIFNVALLILAVPFYLSPHIAPICLTSQNSGFDFQNCFVTGWGKLNMNSEEYSNILKKIKLPVLQQNTCNSLLSQVTRNNYTLHATSICAGGEKDVGVCMGDGGAPLVCSTVGNPNRFYQAGIVSYAFSCGLENVPAVYTNVTYFMPWINQELRKLNISNTYYTSTN